MKDRIVHLLSNAESDRFPSNTPSSFVNNIPELNFDASYSCGLLEASYSNRVLTFGSECKLTLFDFLHKNDPNTTDNPTSSVLWGKAYEIFIPDRQYESVSALVDELNEQIYRRIDRLKGKPIFFYDPTNSKFVHYKIENLYLHLRLIGVILYVIGCRNTKETDYYVSLGLEKKGFTYEFVSEQGVKETRKLINPIDLKTDETHNGWFVLEPVLNNKPEALLFYCNIISEQIAANEYVKLLRLCPLTVNNSTDRTVISFDKVHFLELQTYNIRRIEIEIRDIHGERVLFPSNTLTRLSLLFRSNARY